MTLEAHSKTIGGLWPGQAYMLAERRVPNLSVVSGNGYGKTHFGVRWHFSRVQINKGVKFSIIAAPQQSHLKGAILPLYQDHLDERGMIQGRHYKISSNPLEIYFPLIDHRVLLKQCGDERSARRIVGFNCGFAWIDEAGLTHDLTPIELAKRVRIKCPAMQTLATGTPEGVDGWFFRRAGTELTRPKGSLFSWKKSNIVLHGRTFDNPALPDGYMQNILREFGWNKNLLKSYIYGEFVPVYEFSCYDFDENKHVCNVEPDPWSPIVLSWDFNVSSGNMGLISWIAIQEASPNIVCVAENSSKARNTLEAAQNFIAQFPPAIYKNTEIIIVGDSNGYNRDTRQDGNDYTIIEQALRPHYPYLQIKARRANPSIQLRTATVNRLFSPDFNKSLLVNKKCTRLRESFRVTTIDKFGKLEKPQGDVWTHPSDAAGYGIFYLAPMLKPISRQDISRAQFAL